MAPIVWRGLERFDVAVGAQQTQTLGCLMVLGLSFQKGHDLSMFPTM